MSHALPYGSKVIEERLGSNPWAGTNRGQAEILWRRVISVKATCLFYDELLRQGKDVAYYGDAVTAEDANAVLMRWRISEDQYRVIFGNLTTKDISATRLAELEGASSKE
jgi:hypothetical protein